MKHLLAFAFLCIAVFATAQTDSIAVSGKLNPMNQDAKVANVVDPDSKQVCGMLRIEFDNPDDLLITLGSSGSGRAVQTAKRTGGIDVFVAPGTRVVNLRSQSNRFNVVSYTLDDRIESAAVYDITTRVIPLVGTVTIQQAVSNENWLIVNCVTPDTEISINRNDYVPLNKGYYNVLLPYGRHQLTVQTPTGMYHPYTANFEIQKEPKTELTISLKPAFGSLSVSSTPPGATVFIDQQRNASKTPFTIQEIKSGTKKVRLQMDEYAIVEREVVVNDGELAQLNISLSPTFAQVTIQSADPEAMLYVSDVYKGKGAWSGRLGEGSYVVEARRDQHVASSQKINVIKGQELDLKLDPPTPITGLVRVSSSERDAVVSLGFIREKAPCDITALIGAYELSVTKEGYKPFKRSITVEEGKTFSEHVILEKIVGALVSIKTDEGVKIYHNDVLIGTSTFQGELPLGMQTFSFVTPLGNRYLKEFIVSTNLSNIIDFPIYSILNVLTDPKRMRFKLTGPSVVSKNGKEFVVEPGNYVAYSKAGWGYRRARGYATVGQNESKELSLMRFYDSDYLSGFLRAEYGYENQLAGLSIGYLKGGFSTYLTLRSTFNVDKLFKEKGELKEGAWLTKKPKMAAMQGTFGFIHRLGIPLYLYYGGGVEYSGYEVSYATHRESVANVKLGYAFDAGLMLRISRVVLSGGATFGQQSGLSTMIGLGWIFAED